jgi:hypothetical protein
MAYLHEREEKGQHQQYGNFFAQLAHFADGHEGKKQDE